MVAMRQTSQHLPTADDVRAQMQAHGVTITEWAEQRGFSRATTYAVLAGRVKGLRGEAYRIARALGIVEPPPDSQCRWLRKEGRSDNNTPGE